MSNLQQQISIQRLKKVLIVFFVLAALSLVAIYVAMPSLYTEILKLQPSPPTSPYPLAVTLFVVGILCFITVLIIGVVRDWRWVFWLVLIAFACAILDIPATLFQFKGIVPGHLPLWYSLSRMGVACIQVGIAVWMGYIYYNYGVWGLGRKKKAGRIEGK